MNRTGRIVATALGLWLATAIAIGASGVYYGVPTPVVGATNGLLVTLTLFTVYVVGPVRAWVMELDLRWLVLYHVVRFVGIAFLVLHASGKIPGAFAVTAGWGDIAVAVTALAVVFWVLPIASRADWWAVLLWNLFGLLDIVYVLRTGIGLGLADPGQMAWITAFPMSLVPTFIVPLVLVTHVLIFVRLWKLWKEPRIQRA